jgi:hypothetical protein
MAWSERSAESCRCRPVFRSVDEAALPRVTETTLAGVPADVLTPDQCDRDGGRTGVGHKNTLGKGALSATSHRALCDHRRNIGVLLDGRGRHAGVERAIHDHAVAGKRADVGINSWRRRHGKRDRAGAFRGEEPAVHQHVGARRHVFEGRTFFGQREARLHDGIASAGTKQHEIMRLIRRVVVFDFNHDLLAGLGDQTRRLKAEAVAHEHLHDARLFRGCSLGFRGWSRLGQKAG